MHVLTGGAADAAVRSEVHLCTCRKRRRPFSAVLEVPAHCPAASFDRAEIGICAARLKIDGEEIALSSGWGGEYEAEGAARGAGPEGRRGCRPARASWAIELRLACSGLYRRARSEPVVALFGPGRAGRWAQGGSVLALRSRRGRAIGRAGRQPPASACLSSTATSLSAARCRMSSERSAVISAAGNRGPNFQRSATMASTPSPSSRW